jgi:hypothetical protein
MTCWKVARSDCLGRDLWFLFFFWPFWAICQTFIKGKIQGEIEVTGRQGRRRTKLLDDLKERKGYSYLKEEALDRTMWRALFGRGFGPVVRQTTKWKWMNHIRTPPPSNFFLCVLLLTTRQVNWEFRDYLNPRKLGKVLTKASTEIDENIKRWSTMKWRKTSRIKRKTATCIFSCKGRFIVSCWTCWKKGLLAFGNGRCVVW